MILFSIVCGGILEQRALHVIFSYSIRNLDKIFCTNDHHWPMMIPLPSKKCYQENVYDEIKIILMHYSTADSFQIIFFFIFFGLFLYYLNCNCWCYSCGFLCSFTCIIFSIKTVSSPQLYNFGEEKGNIGQKMMMKNIPSSIILSRWKVILLIVLHMICWKWNQWGINFCLFS